MDTYIQLIMDNWGKLVSLATAFYFALVHHKSDILSGYRFIRTEGGLRGIASSLIDGDPTRDQLLAENIMLKNYNGQLNSMVLKPNEQMLAEAQVQLVKPISSPARPANAQEKPTPDIGQSAGLQTGGETGKI